MCIRDSVKPEDGIIRGVVTHVIFKGVHYEMEVMANNYEWLVHSTDMFPVGAEAVSYTHLDIKGEIDIMAGSTYGTLFRITTWGESHGPAIGVVIDGCPSGPVSYTHLSKIQTWIRHVFLILPEVLLLRQSSLQSEVLDRKSVV